jgi:outer membrane biosynthesis protein TonB
VLAGATRSEGPERLPALRPAPAGRRALIARLGALLLLSLAVLTAGCGADEESAADPPPTAPELTIPETDKQQPAPPTETTPTTETTPPATDGGTPTPQPDPTTPTDAPENDTPPPQDSPAQRFEEFCNDNPGACG